MPSKAEQLVKALLDGGGEEPKDFMQRNNLVRMRRVDVREDPSHAGWFQIPVYDHSSKPGSHFVNLFRPKTNPKREIKDRLQHLVRNRTGYQVGDLFRTPWGWFLLTDSFGIKEV